MLADGESLGSEMKQNEKLPKDLIVRIFAAVRGVGDQGDLTREVIAEVLGLNRTDLAGVDFLYSQNGTCTAGELSRATRLTSGSTTALIDRLEQAEYALREGDPTDRRRQIVRLSDKAHARCESVYELIKKEMLKLWSNYSASELELIVRFLTEGTKLHGTALERLRGTRFDSDAKKAQSSPRARKRL
jgi:DNA-binding MarR family transcriptional regulator